MKSSNIAAVILAAGKGTRMQSDLPKVLHQINSKSLISYVAECASKIVGDNLHVVIGHQADKVKDEVSKKFNAVYAFQKDMLGTGDAVKVALEGMPERIKDIFVLNGDVPFIKTRTLQTLMNVHMAEKNAVTLLTVEIDNPEGYGRIVQDDHGNVLCIKEESDATLEEKKIKMVNSGIYCFDRKFLDYSIPKIDSSNSQEEYYLTDVMEIAIEKGMKTGLLPVKDWREVVGINTADELENARELLKEIGL